MRNTSFKLLFAFIVALFTMATGEVRALPQGGKVESGRGDLSNPAQIIQNSSHLQTSWHSFDIGKNEVVNINQPSAAASIVIGVRNGLGTNINGTLNANGRVTLENPAGVQFGRSSVVNVGGLLATTGQGALSSLGQINAANKVHLQNLGGNIVNIGGAVSAQEITVESNGDVVIGGTAALSAGNILIGGDYQGKGAIANARTTRVEAGASLDAGIKGRIIVWSDENTYFGGSLNAPKGFAEVSGKRKLQTARNFFSSVNVGTLLLDPQNITIQAALLTGETQHTIAANVGVGDAPTESYIILTADLAGYGADLILSATGDITISDALNIGSAAGADPVANPAVRSFSLVLNAGGNVAINAAVTVFNTPEQLTLTAGQTPANFSVHADGTINVAAPISANDISLLSGYDADARNTAKATSGAITTTSAAILTATDTLDIRSATSNITLGAAISGVRDVRVASGATLALNANVTSEAFLELSGVSVTTTGTSGTPIELSLNGAFIIGASGGAIPTLGTELMLVAGTVITDFTLTYGGAAALTISASLIDLPSDSFTLVSTNAAAAITMGAITDRDLALDVDVEGTLNLGGNLAVKSFRGKALFASAASITLDALESLEIRDGSTWTTTGALTITTSATAPTVGIANPLILGGSFTVGSLAVNYAALGNTLTLGSDFSVTAATTINLNVAGIDRTAGNLSLTTTTGNITLPRTIDVSGGNLTLMLGGALAFNGTAGPINFTAADITLGGTLQTSDDFTVAASGKLLFANGTNLIQGANVFLTSATAPVAIDFAGITSGTTTIAAPGGTITLNAKINVGTAGELVITTRASGGAASSVIATGAIVFGTTTSVELTANILRLHTSDTGGALGAEMTTLTAVGGDTAFIEVQGNLLFTDLNIISSGGFKAANLGAGTDTYTTTLNASGEMRVNLGNHATAAMGDVLASSTSTGGTYAHDLFFTATSALFWEQGGIDNQIGRVRLLSAANTSISTTGASVLKGAGVVVNNLLVSLPPARRGAHSIWVENTDAAGFIFLGAAIDSVGDVTIESAGHIRFRAARGAYIRGGSVSYDVQTETPADVARLDNTLTLVADSGNINVTGYLELDAAASATSSIQLIANAGVIVFGAFTDGTVTQTTVTANSIELSVLTDFTDLNNRPANFSVAPVILVDGGASAVYWQPGPIVRRTTQGTAGGITLTAGDITAAGYTISADGVVDFGTDSFTLEAGTDGTDSITLPASVREIRAASISLIGTIMIANGLTLTSAGALSLTGSLTATVGNITLAGVDITFGQTLMAAGDLTVTASGKLLFGNGDNAIGGANVSLTSATAPTAADIAGITSGTTTITAAGGTVTLNAKINVGPAGNLTITTRATSATAPSAIAAGAIVFGTTDPVELTASTLRLHTSSTGGAVGTETTTLTAVGGDTAFIEIQGNLLFADLNIISSGGFKAADLGAALAAPVTHTTTLDASGVIRINLGNHATTAAMGDVLGSSMSTGGTFTHDLSFVAAGDLLWIQGGIQNNIGSLSLTSGAAISISTAGASVLKGAGVVITSGGRALADDRRGTHSMWLENTDAAGFLSLGSVINTAGDVTIESTGTITFLAGADASISGKSVSYTSTVEDTTSKLEGALTLIAFNGNINVTGYLEVATGASVSSSIVLRAPVGEIMFNSTPKVSANSILLDVQEDFVDANGDPLPAPADFSVAPRIHLASYSSIVLWQHGQLTRQTADGVDITITEADITGAGFTIDNGVLDLGNGDLILEAGTTGTDTIMLPASITTIRAGFISIIGILVAANGLELISATELFLTGSLTAMVGNITLEGTNITLSGTVMAAGDAAVTASGKLLFADGANLIQGANVSLISAIAPTAADVSVITSTSIDTTTIRAPGGTITLNAKINLGTAGVLDITTGASTGAVIAAGAIVFGTTTPVELTARTLRLHTSIASATGGVRGTETTTLTTTAPFFGGDDNFIEVQGNLLFADLNIISAGGFKVANLGNGTTAYATTLDASGVMRINLHAASVGSTSPTSISTGGTLTHDLSLVAAGDLFWERGDFENQIGGIRLSSGATTSISTVGRSFLKGEGIEITSAVRSLPDVRRGTTLINLENTDAARPITLNADIYTTGVLIVKSAGAITFLAGADASLAGSNVTYEAAVEATSKLEGALTLTALNGNITVVGFLQVAAGGTTTSSLVLRTLRGRITFTSMPTVSADSILLEALIEFTDLNNRPANFSVAPRIIIGGGASAVSWQAGVVSISRSAAGDLTLTDAEITTAGFAIDADGVLDLGTGILILRAGTASTTATPAPDALTLPATITEIRAGGIVLVGSITSATGLTLTSTGDVSLAGSLIATSGDIIVAASGKLLFGNDTYSNTLIQAANVSLTSAIAPTSRDTDGITFNRVTTIRAPGGTITLNAKISLGSRGNLTITTRATGAATPAIVAAGSIVFGTTAPVELTARTLLLETSATGGERGTETTTLSNTDGFSGFIGVQGNLLFADLNITANGGLKVINLGDGADAYTTTLDASGEMRVNLRSDIHGSTISSGGARIHNLSLVAAGDLFWEKGAVATSVGGVSLVSGAILSFSTEGDSLLSVGKGNLVIEGAVPLTAARRGTGGISLITSDANGYISLGTAIDTGGSTLTTAGNVTITSSGHIRFPAGTDVSITGTSVTYNVQKDDATAPKLEGSLTMSALFGNVNVTGYLELATGGTTASSITLSSRRGGVVFNDFTDGGTSMKTQVSADSITLAVRNEFDEFVAVTQPVQPVQPAPPAPQLPAIPAIPDVLVPLRAAPADFSTAPIIIFRGERGASAVLWQADAFGGRSDENTDLVITLEDIFSAGFVIQSGGVVDLGSAKLVLEAGSLTNTITLPAAIRGIRAGSITIFGSLVATADLTLTSAGAITLVGSFTSTARNDITLSGTDITFGRSLMAGGDLTVTASGKLLFPRLIPVLVLAMPAVPAVPAVPATPGVPAVPEVPAVPAVFALSDTTTISGANVSLTSAVAPTTEQVAALNFDNRDSPRTTIISAVDGVITLNAKINLGTASFLILTTAASGALANAPIANGSIVFGTTAPVELTAREVHLRTSLDAAAGGVRGTHPTTLTALGAREVYRVNAKGPAYPVQLYVNPTIPLAFIRVQGHFFFADLNLTSSSGFQVAHLGNGTDARTSTLDASGVMRVNLVASTRSSFGSLTAIASAGGTYTHNLSLIAAGDLFWEKGYIENHIGGISLVSGAAISFSTEGDSYLGANVRGNLVIEGAVPLTAARRGTGDIVFQATDANGFISLGAVIDTTGAVAITSAGHIRFPAGQASLIRGSGVSYNVAREAPATPRLEGLLTLSATRGNIDVRGFLQLAAGGTDASLLILLAPLGRINFHATPTVSADSILLGVGVDFTSITTAPANFSVAPLININGIRGISAVSWQDGAPVGPVVAPVVPAVEARFTAATGGLTLTEADITAAITADGYTLANGVLDFGAHLLFLTAGTATDTITLPAGVTSIRAGAITIVGTLAAANGLTLTSAGALSWMSGTSTPSTITGNITLAGTDITLGGRLGASSDFTVTARGKLLFADGLSTIQGANVSLTSATAPTAADAAALTAGSTLAITAPGGTITLNAKINLGGNDLTITTRVVGASRGTVVAAGAIVFGTTAPVELTAKDLIIETSLDSTTNGVRGTHPTTLTSTGQYTEVQGHFLFADLNITTTGGFKVADLGAALATPAAYTTTLDALGVMRINIVNPSNTSGGVEFSSQSAGGAYDHNLSFVAAGDLFWEKGGIQNNIGGISLISGAAIAISTAGPTVLKAEFRGNLVIDSAVPVLSAAHRGAHDIFVESRYAAGFFSLSAPIDTTGAVRIRAEGHMRFSAGASVRGSSIDYDVLLDDANAPRLQGTLTMTATTGNINVGGFLLLASGPTVTSGLVLRANAGAIVFDSATPTVTLPTVTANSIQLEALTEFTNLTTAPANFSVAPRITIAGGLSAALWQGGVFVRVTAADLTLTAAELTTAGFAIDANGVLNFGATALVLHAGTTGANTITLPASVTSIRAGSISILGTLSGVANISLASLSTLSLTGTFAATNNIVLEGVNIILSGSLQATGNLAVTARGKLLFGNGMNTLQGANVSLISTIVPTAADIVGITGGTTTITAPGGTITLNAKIDVGTAGELIITTRAGALSNTPVAAGTIIFGTIVPVELNAKTLRLHTSASSRGGRLLGLYPTILKATGATGAEGDAFIEVQGNFLFARLTVTSTGGFKVADLGAAPSPSVTYLTTLHSSRVMRINLGNHADAATGMVLDSSTSMGSGTYTHDILFLAESDLFWEKGGIENEFGRVRLLSRTYTSISREGASVLKGRGITANHRIRPLPANRRGLHNIWVENTDPDGFIFFGAALDTAGDVTLTSAGHIRFRGNREGSIRAKSISYDVQKDLASAPKLNARFTLTAVNGNVSVTGYLQVATGGTTDSSIVLSAPEGGIVFEAFMDADNPAVTQTKLTANNIELDVKDDFTGSAAPADFSVLPVVIVAGAEGASGGSGASWQVGVFGRGTAQGTSLTITEADIAAAGYTITNGVLDLGTDRLILRAGRDGTNNIVLPSSITSIRASFITMVGTIVSETPLTFTSAGNLSFAGNLLLNSSLTIEATDVTMGGSLTAFGDINVTASRKLLFANGNNIIQGDNIFVTSAMAPTAADVAVITGGGTALTALGGTITVNAKIDVGSKGELILSTRGADLGAAPIPTPYLPIPVTGGVPIINPSTPSVITEEAAPAPVSAGAIVFGTTAPVELTAGLLRLHTSLDSATNGVRGTYPTTLNAGGTADFIKIISTLVSDEFVLTGSDPISATNVPQRVTLSALRAVARNDDAFIVALGQLLSAFEVIRTPSGALIFTNNPGRAIRANFFNPGTGNDSINNLSVDELLESLITKGDVEGTNVLFARTILTRTLVRAVLSPASDAFIEVQGNLLFADLNINSTGGIKVADLGAARSGVADYTTTLDASGVMRVNLGNHTDAAMGSVLGSSTSTGGTLTHDLAFVAGGNLLWEKGGIENQIGGVSLFSNNDTSLSTTGASVLKGKGIVIDGDVPANRRGVSNIWLENTDAAGSIFLGVAIDSTGNVTTKSAGTIAFRAGREALIKGRSITYDALTEDTTSKLEGSLTLEALEGNIDVTGYLEVATGLSLNSSIRLFARKGEIVFNTFAESGARAQTRVEADRIQLEAAYDFQETVAVGGAPATFNVAPDASISSATGGITGQSWLVATP